MTALALLSAVCYGAFHVGIRAVQRGEVAVVTAQRLRVVADLMIRQVKSAVATVPAGRVGGEADEADEDFDPDFVETCPLFVGSSTSVTFLTAAGLLGGGGLSLVTYRIVPDPPRLVIEESPWPAELPGSDPSATARSTVALDGFEAAWFEYHPPIELGEPTLGSAAWNQVWDACDDEADWDMSLPAAVRFVVRGLPGMEVAQWTQEIPVMLASASPENALGGETF
jgi:hypothetical protein